VLYIFISKVWHFSIFRDGMGLVMGDRQGLGDMVLVLGGMGLGDRELVLGGILALEEGGMELALVGGMGQVLDGMELELVLGGMVRSVVHLHTLHRQCIHFHGQHDR